MAARSSIIEIQCSKCRNSFSETEKLSCAHEYCHTCISECKKGDSYQCVARGCGKTSTKSPVIVQAMSISDLVKRMKDMSYKYHSDLLRRENECGDQIKRLGDALTDLHQEEKKQLDSLCNSLEERQKQLSDHYNVLESNVKKSINEREKQLTNIISDVKQMMSKLQDEIKEMKDYFKETDNLTKSKLEELERRTENSYEQTVEVDIPKVQTQIIKAEGLSLEDSIQIVAPEPTLYKNKIELKSSLLTSLTEKPLRSVKDVVLRDRCQALSYISGELYSSEGSSGISVYNRKLGRVRTIKAGKMADIYGVAGIADGSLVIAANNGLFHIAGNGNIMGTIAEYFHSSVRYRDGTVYASVCHNKVSPPCQINSYQLKDSKWIKTNRKGFAIPCAYDHHLTLAIGNDVIYASCIQDDCLYILSRSTGTMLQKVTHQGQGEMTSLRGPCAAQTDKEDSLLICDLGNNQLVVYTSDGKWKLVSTANKLTKPSGAAFVDGMLFVSSGDGNKLHTFTPSDDPKNCTIQ